MNNKKNEEIWIHTQNPRRFPGFTVAVVTFSSKSSTISMILFRNVSLSLGNSTTHFGVSPFFRRKVTIVIGSWNKNTHFTNENQRKKNIAKVSSSNIIVLVAEYLSIQQQQQQQQQPQKQQTHTHTHTHHTHIPHTQQHTHTHTQHTHNTHTTHTHHTHTPHTHIRFKRRRASIPLSLHRPRRKHL